MMGTELGKYKLCVSARSTDKEILKKAQDGGIVTALFKYALEEGIIDGAIVSGPSDEPWRARPFVATTVAELMQSRGTRYNISPNVSFIKEATRSYGLDRIGIVGTPCQMQAVRKGQLYPVGLRDVPDKIELAIGIFCMENFPYQSLKQIVEDHGAMKLESVKKMEVGKGKFTITGERGQVVQLPLKWIGEAAHNKYEHPGCHVCLDYVANLADVSTGSVGSPDGWSTVFVRTKKGDSNWSKAINAGCFETKPIEGVKPGLDIVSKLANEKIKENQATLDERAKFGINKALRNPYLSPK
jgi:coenzyme F420 hydrogenase subunit beta